jgi:hypothetical protein
MASDITFFHPYNSWFESDGTLVIGASRYTDDWHETGVRRFASSDPDYEMWCHLAKRYQEKEQVRDFISSEQLPAIREQYERERAAAREV